MVYIIVYILIIVVGLISIDRAYKNGFKKGFRRGQADAAIKELCKGMTFADMIRIEQKILNKAESEVDK